MSLNRIPWPSACPIRPVALLLLLAVGIQTSISPKAAAGTNVVIWDSSSNFSATPDLQDRSGWKLVPSDLFQLELDPPKASSDPGYYGRDYSFKGDAVVANHSVAALFCSETGRVLVYARPDPSVFTSPSAPRGDLGTKIFELAPAHSKSESPTIQRLELVRNASDEIVVRASYSGLGANTGSALFSFGKSETIEVTPDPKIPLFRVSGALDYAVLPSFIGDDLIFNPSDYPDSAQLALPSENALLGLVHGEEHMIVLTWPKSSQRLGLSLGASEGKRSIESIDLSSAGQNFYLTALQAPGIWHQEELKPAFLEKDTTFSWRKPFSAKWQTQLVEAGVRTTFAFRSAKGQIWRGVPGSYTYPIWFDGSTPHYLLSKKVPPKGRSVIYFKEGDDTPASIPTPADIIRSTLGRPAAEAILDSTGRKLRTHHRTGGSGVHRACTCGYTEAIQTVFEKRQEVERKKYVADAVDDMVYFVQRHLERIDEYRHFAEDVSNHLKQQAAAVPALKQCSDTLLEIAQQIPQEYNVQLENMKSLNYASELTRKTLALTERQDPQNLAAFMALLKDWRAMGGAQDYIVAQCHAIARKLCQEAALAAVTQPQAIQLAEEVRRRCRQCLRSPDGYEIWPEY